MKQVIIRKFEWGDHSSNRYPGAMLVTNRAEAASAKEFFVLSKNPFSKTDFEKSYGIILFSGQRTSSGYGILFPGTDTHPVGPYLEKRDGKNVLVIDAVVTKPLPTVMTASVITHPWYAIVIDRVSFDEFEMFLDGHKGVVFGPAENK